MVYAVRDLLNLYLNLVVYQLEIQKLYFFIFTLSVQHNKQCRNETKTVFVHCD